MTDAGSAEGEKVLVMSQDDPARALGVGKLVFVRSADKPDLGGRRDVDAAESKPLAIPLSQFSSR